MTEEQTEISADNCYDLEMIISHKIVRIQQHLQQERIQQHIITVPIELKLLNQSKNPTLVVLKPPKKPAISFKALSTSIINTYRAIFKNLGNNRSRNSHNHTNNLNQYFHSNSAISNYLRLKSNKTHMKTN